MSRFVFFVLLIAVSIAVSSARRPSKAETECKKIPHKIWTDILPCGNKLCDAKPSELMGCSLIRQWNCACDDGYCELADGTCQHI